MDLLKLDDESIAVIIWWLNRSMFTTVKIQGSSLALVSLAQPPWVLRRWGSDRWRARKRWSWKEGALWPVQGHEADKYKGAERVTVWRCSGSCRQNGYHRVGAPDFWGSRVFLRQCSQLHLDPVLGCSSEMPGWWRDPWSCSHGKIFGAFLPTHSVLVFNHLSLEPH